jgi:hypothetical protein
MPGPITHAAVALLARDRLGQIRDALAAKIANGTQVNDIERHVQYLARRAHDMMSLAQPAIQAPARLYGPALTDRVSKFLLLGAAGPDLARYAAMNAAGSRWLFDTMHKGTRDEHKERVLVGSTTFPLDFWARVQPKIRAAFNDKVEARLDTMRAYVLGHLCHVAADVVSQPFVADVEARLGTAARTRLSHDEVIGALDVAVARDLFRRGTETRGSDWAEWWPAARDVPSYFAKAWAEALEPLYGPGARGDHVKGFGAVEKRFAKDDPPALSEALIQDGVDTFREVVESGVAWDLLDWMRATAPIFAPALLAVPFAATLEQLRNAFRETPEPGVVVDGDVAFYERIVFPLAVTSVAPVITMIVLSSSYLDTGGEIVSGWLTAGAQLAAAIGFFATTGGAGRARWAFFFWLPVAAHVANILYVGVQGLGDFRRLQLVLASVFHVGLAALFSLLYPAFLHRGTEGFQDKLFASGDFWLYTGLWLVILAALWMGTSILLRCILNGSSPDPEANELVTGQAHYVHVFDDTALFRAPAATSPTLADLFYPSGRRELLRIWWEGQENPPLSVRSDRDRLVFSFDGAGPGPKQTVFAPVAPTRATEFGEYLTRTVKDSGGAASGNLKSALVHADDLDYELPPGEILADHGDDKDTELEHTAGAAEFRPIGRTKDDGLTLFHVPKSRQAIRVGRTGPVAEEDRTSNAAGAGTLTSQPAPNQTQIRGVAGTDRFLRLFRPGDVVEATAAPIQSRIVVSVDSDTQITVATRFDPALAGAPYRRVGQDRTVDQAPPPGWRITSRPDPSEVIGVLGTVFGQLLKPGDSIQTVPRSAQERRIVAVVSGTQLTLDRPLDPAANAAGVVRVADAAGTPGSFVSAEQAGPVGGGLTSRPPPNDTVIDGVAGVDQFLTLFQPGDIVETTGGVTQRRVIVAIASNTRMTVVTPFNPALAADAYKRARQDRTSDMTTSPDVTVTSQPGPSDLTGSPGTEFGDTFRPGDIVRITAVPLLKRRVVAIITNGRLRLDEPVIPGIAGAAFVRLADEAADGFDYVGRVSPGDDTLLTGGTLLNEAADLAVLLCLGGASNLVTDAERHKTADMHNASTPLNAVAQVFRNWNLDRRRQNEWKMLIAGGAVSEKRGDPTALDAALPPLPAGWALLAGRGEATANALGWVPLLRAWLDMARRPGTDTKAPSVFKPGMPTNLQLSRGLAYLLDMRDPDPVAP